MIQGRVGLSHHISLASGGKSGRLSYSARGSHDKDLFSDEELDIYVDNYMRPGNVHGGFNFYWAGQRGTWTKLDYTISDCPMTFLQGLEDLCIPSTWTDKYNNYSIETCGRTFHDV